MFFEKNESCILSVEGMHCNHCKARVENAVMALKGVKSAVADLEKATLTAEFKQSKINEDDIVKAVNELGFKASKK